MNADAHKENAEKFFSPAVSNEPTRAEKEAAFEFWLEKYWNEGPFTDTSENPRMKYPTGFSYLDLGSGFKHEKDNPQLLSRVASLYGYGYDVDHNYVGLISPGKRENEMMMLEFILLDLADELGYELIELQNEGHWRLYQNHKEKIEKGGWIPYDGKGMPEGLEEKLVYIWCFGYENNPPSVSIPVKCYHWSWHAADNEDEGTSDSAIAFYKVKEEQEAAQEQEPVGNQENDNV